MSILTTPPPPADHTARYGGDPSQFGELWLPAGGGPFPVVVNLHGGFWRERYDLHHTSLLCAALRQQGLALWNLEYRRIGHAGGGWPGTFNDVVTGIRFLNALARQHPLDLSRVLLMGHSAGGHLALWAASRPTGVALRGVVALAPVADLRRAWELGLSERVVETLLGATPAEQPQRYAAASPIEQLPLGLPTRLIHGAQDEIVPIGISEGYVRAAREAGDPATLVALPAADHFDLIDPRSDAWAAVPSAIHELMEPGGASDLSGPV